MINTKRIVIKIGSSLLADQSRLTPRWAFLQRIMEDIALLRDEGIEVVLCSSGAVALGMKMIGVTPETAGLRDKQAAAACGMPLLLGAYKQIGHEYEINVAQILVTLGDFEDHPRFLNTKNTLQRLFRSKVLPIINENDTITTEEIRVGDNDRLAAKVAQMVGATDFVILTGVDGLYDRNPDDPDAVFIPEVTDVGPYMDATKGKSTLGTGGMETKLQAANMAQEAGVTTWIAQGEVDRPLSTVLDGSRRATKILPNPNPLSGWDSWIANRLQMAGSVVISEATANSLAKSDRPIRREDIVSMDGDFTRGDVLHIYDSKGIERARGLSDFTSEELRVLIHNPDTAAEQLLGYKTRGEIIRGNNLVMLETRHLLWDAPHAITEA